MPSQLECHHRAGVRGEKQSQEGGVAIRLGWGLLLCGALVPSVVRGNTVYYTTLALGMRSLKKEDGSDAFMEVTQEISGRG